MELSLFYRTAENLTLIFKRVILFRCTEVSQCLLFCCCFFLSKHFTFLCSQQPFYLEQGTSFERIMILCMMLDQSNFQVSSKFTKLYSLKIHTSAFHSKCEMLPKFLGSWSICSPQATSICPLPQYAHIPLCGLIQFQGQIIRFRHNWETLSGNFKSSSSTS